MNMREISTTRLIWPECQNKTGTIQFEMRPERCAPEVIVDRLASIEGPVDVYFWYEGCDGQPEYGAHFMKEKIFDPLCRQKNDAKLCLYSLAAWKFTEPVSGMAPMSLLGQAINRINATALECISSSSFFRYCTEAVNKRGLYSFISEELPKKQWLYKLSAARETCGKTVETLFDNQSSLFDCIKGMDLKHAYSSMQYVEAYYLIQESVKKGLNRGQKQIEIAFVLPNDESKYYNDLSKDVEKMLQLDFGSALNAVEIKISFQFFKYGKSQSLRPYIDTRPNAVIVPPEEIAAYLVPRTKPPKPLPQTAAPYFSREIIHNLNGWY